MKRIIITFITVFSMCCLVACSSETTDDTATDSNNEVVVNNDDDNPVTTAEATVEPTKEPSSDVADVEPTEEPVAEATPEPTEEPVLYPGIDMESDLPGAEWIETFVGIIEEPKIVVYSDTTGRKEIVEEKATVLINPDEDIIAIYLPPGYMYGGSSIGIKHTDIIDLGYSCSFLLDSERTREKKYETAAICYKHETPEEYYLKFTIESQ